MEKVDQESEQIKDVYAYFGLLIYLAQCIEKSLTFLMTAVWGKILKNLGEYDETFDRYSKSTLGALLKEMKKYVINIPDNLRDNMDSALKRRNWLAHHYFWERAGCFVSESGREGIIKELKSIKDEFDSLDHTLSGISPDWCRKRGITDKMMKEIEQEIIRNSHMPVN